MKRVIALTLLCLLLAVPAYAAKMDIGDLIEQGSKYNQQRVLLIGEVIGDVMARGDYTWMNVMDDTGAMGLVIPSPLAKGLTPGRYGVAGSIVSVEGMFYKACPAHGGDMDVHVESLTVLSGPQVEQQVIKWTRFRAVALLCFFWLGLLLWPRLKVSRRA